MTVFINRLESLSEQPVCFISRLSAAGTPATGAVTTLFVLEVAGLPTKNASILFAVEWILDRLNTVVNVWSDCVCVKIVDVLSKRELEDIEQEQTPRDDAEGRFTPGSAGQQILLPNSHLPPPPVPHSHLNSYPFSISI
ncbi:excitatory amino acid transporter 3-like [Pseudoliparis swirei]|uniref:excitatory amino acid transporter 3-like n=1 Tax=Pseudoliparis swirei TaxID=2059687 RepID=UPI0024BE2310|nr:excitatory amino acid transporter 3-like [Pseudoliparis swirei]